MMKLKGRKHSLLEYFVNNRADSIGGILRTDREYYTINDICLVKAGRNSAYFTARTVDNQFGFDVEMDYSLIYSGDSVEFKVPGRTTFTIEQRGL